MFLFPFFKNGDSIAFFVKSFISFQCYLSGKVSNEQRPDFLKFFLGLVVSEQFQNFQLCIIKCNWHIMFLSKIKKNSHTETVNILFPRPGQVSVTSNRGEPPRPS